MALQQPLPHEREPLRGSDYGTKVVVRKVSSEGPAPAAAAFTSRASVLRLGGLVWALQFIFFFVGTAEQKKIH